MKKNCHFLICKGTKSFLFPRHSFSYTCSRESSSGATFFWAFLKRNRRKRKNKSLFWQYSSWGQGKLLSSSQFATLPCSSLVPHGLYGTFMPRRNTGYASLGGKLNLIHSLFFSFIFSFFCVCVWPILFQPMFFFFGKINQNWFRRTQVWCLGWESLQCCTRKKKCLQCLSGWLIMSTAWHRYPAFSFAN